MIIDKNVAIPKTNHLGRQPAYPFHEMEIGDSFKVSPDKALLVRNASNGYGSRHGKKFSVRKMEDGTYRCWRIS